MLMGVGKSKKKNNNHVTSANVRRYLFKYGGKKLGVRYAKDIPSSTIELIKYSLREEGKRVTARNIKSLLCDKFIVEKLGIKECRGRKKKEEYKPTINSNLLDENGYWHLRDYGEDWIPESGDDIFFDTSDLFGKDSAYLQGGRYYPYEDTFKELVDACNEFVNEYGEATSSHTLLVFCDEDTLSFNKKRNRWEIRIRLIDELTGHSVKLGGLSGIRELIENKIERSEEKEQAVRESLMEREGKEKEVEQEKKRESERESEKLKELELAIEKEKRERVEREIELANKQGILELTKMLGRKEITKDEYLELIKVFK